MKANFWKILTVVMILMVSVGNAVLAQANGSDRAPQVEQRVMPEEQFIDLFRRKYTSDSTSTGVEKRFAAATEYIQRCCKSREEIIHLLERNGFKVNVYTSHNAEVPRKGTKISYDELIAGTRSPGIRRFWQITTTYRADIYLEDGNVVLVFAVVDTTVP